MEPISRSDHLEWCKVRAREYIRAGDYQQAYTSMASDLRNHCETEHHVGINIGLWRLMDGKLNTEQEITKFIEGFN